MAYAIREWEVLAPILNWHILFANRKDTSQEFALKPPIHEWHILVGNSITGALIISQVYSISLLILISITLKIYL